MNTANVEHVSKYLLYDPAPSNWEELKEAVDKGLVEGAKITRGRWHFHIPVIYTTETSSLAILELLGYYINKGLIQADYNLITIEVESKEVAIKDIYGELPYDWEERADVTMSMGNKWFDSRETCLLRVPSVHNPLESNLLINPMHRDFENISVKDVLKYSFNKKFY